MEAGDTVIFSGMNTQPSGSVTTCVARWKSVAMYLIISAGTLAPLTWYWSAGLTLIHRDQPTYFAPIRWLAGQALREGRLPLWNPFNATGMPYLASMTHGALHPLSVITAFLFPSDSLDPLMGAYILAAGLGAGLCARTLGASRPACILAGLAYSLSGYMLSMTSNMNNLTGTASVPWILAGLRLSAGKGTAAAFAGGALAVAACALCGDIQELIVACLVGILLGWDVAGRRGLALAVGATVVGGLLSGIQLLPSWSFLPLTHRIFPLPAYDMNQWDLAPWRLIEFISPGFFWVPEDWTAVAPVFVALGHPTWFNIPMTESVFIGAATLFLALAGIRNERTTRLIAIAALIVLWVAMGRHLGARTLQNMLPLVNGFRYGEKFLPTFLSCIAVLAALGADRLVADTRAALRAAIVTVVSALLMMVVWGVLGSNWSQQLFQGVEHGEAIRTHLLRGIPHAFAAGFALAACCMLAAKKRRVPALAGMVAVVWCSALAAVPFAVRPGHPEARVAVTPPLFAAPSPGPRVMTVQSPREHAVREGWDRIDQFVFSLSAGLLPNTNAWHRIDSFGVDSGFFPLRWYQLNQASREDIALIARRYGVTHLLFPTPETDRGKAIVARVTQDATQRGTDHRNGMEIWEVPHRPWAAFPARVATVRDANSALQAVIQNVDAGWDTAYVESAHPLPSGSGRVVSVKRDLERIEVVAEADSDATLIVNDAYWPGWQASIDGGTIPIFPADALVRAVRWPAGRHTLVMKYDPPEVRQGMWVSGAGLVALCCTCFAIRYRGRSKTA